MAVLSFVISSGIVAAGISVYLNQDDIIEDIKENVIEGVSEVLPELITGALGGASLGTDLAPTLPEAEVPSIPSF